MSSASLFFFSLSPVCATDFFPSSLRPFSVPPCSALIPSIDLAGKPGTGSTMADYRKEYVPASALRTDAGPSRPAAGPEAVSVTRGEGVVVPLTPRTTTPATAIGECDLCMCCSCHMYGYTTLQRDVLSCWMRPGQRDILLLLAVHRSQTVIGQV